MEALEIKKKEGQLKIVFLCQLAVTNSCVESSIDKWLLGDKGQR